MPRLLAKLGVPAVLLMSACAEPGGATAGVTTTIDTTDT